MKETLFCKIFGHKFCWWCPRNDGSDISELRTFNYCVRCGLTKEEIDSIIN